KNALTPWTPSRQWRGTTPMAQTDARAGFRLPWSSERPNTEQAETDGVANAASDVAGGWPETDAAPTTDQPTDSTGQTTDAGWGTDWGTGADETAAEATETTADADVAAAPTPARTPRRRSRAGSSPT